jgi:class 3 adenylate cyclase
MEKSKFRMDFKIEESEILDEKQRIVRFRLVPDPDRYEERTVDGEEGYYDKYDHIFFTKKALAEAAKTLAGPIYGPAASVGDLKVYFTEAEKRVASSLQSEVEWQPQVDRANAFLSLNMHRKVLFVVLYIDIVNSTQLSRTLSDVAQRTVVRTFLREMSLLIDGHGGYVHKYTGDGLIAFFPAEDGYTTTTDGAVDCAIVMKLIVAQVVNPLLRKSNYPALQVRIGLDSGETQIVGLGAENVKYTVDLLGYTMNLAAKICAVCPPDGVLIGESVYKSIHITRKKRFKEMIMPAGKWNYLDATTNRVYPLFYLIS